MVYNFSDYIHSAIHMGRLEFACYILIALVIGLLIGVFITMGSVQKPTSIMIAQIKEEEDNKGGIGETDVKDLDAMAKFLNPFNE